MIDFALIDYEGQKYRAILMDEEGMEKEVLVHERALNTLSPNDPELLKVLDDMKGMK